MSYADAIAAHVGLSLRRDFELSEIERDDDGDWPVLCEDVLCWVHVCDDRAPLARVWSIAVRDVKRSAALLAELNDLNAESRLVRCFWQDRSIVVAAEVVAESIEPGELRRLVRTVSRATRHVGELVAAVFGGHPGCLIEAQSEITET
jgi:hypothetical protein